jgi:hypothetical protein
VAFFCLFRLLKKYFPKPAAIAIAATTPTTIPAIAPPDIRADGLDVGEMVDVGETVDVALTLGGVVELEDV